MPDKRSTFLESVGSPAKSSSWEIVLPILEGKKDISLRVQNVELPQGALTTLPLQLNYLTLNYVVGLDYSEGFSITVLESATAVPSSRDFFSFWKNLGMDEDGNLGKVGDYKKTIEVKLSLEGKDVTAKVVGAFPINIGKLSLVRLDSSFVKYDVQFMIDEVRWK